MIKMNKKLIMMGVFLLLAFLSYASGKREIEEKVVENSSSWNESFDISEKEEGKYNILITASDSGGNTSIAGPFNVFIDPDSDLPITNITNPVSDGSVLGNLNIVGTSVDDDAVSYVELIIDGNIESPIRAEGTEFWSYFLDTSTLDEGDHTIEAYSVDINGLKGNSSFVTWNLNRRQPTTTVDNFALGQLVSGKIDLDGTVIDGNGIESLMYSLDRGETFKSLRIKHNKNEGTWNFSLPIDTTEIADGPTICWLKAEDMLGSSSVYTWLFFVDNTKPNVEIVYPKEEQIVNGIFSVSGLAQDIIGIETLTWSLGDESGDFELIPGNPYWVQDFDLLSFTGKKATLSISATDTAGNKTTVKRTFIVDANSDKPTVSIQFPPLNYTISDSLYVRGIAQDDDGIAQVLYSLNGQAEIAIETDGVFYANLPLPEEGLAIGEHTLTVRALDIHGIYGEPVTIPLIFEGNAPVFANPLIIPDKRMEPVLYVYGMTLKTTPNTTFEYTATGKNLVRATWQLGNGTPHIIELTSPKSVIELNIPLGDVPLGLLPLYVTATDSMGRETKETLALYIEKSPPEPPKKIDPENPPAPVILKAPLTTTVTWIPESYVQTSLDAYSIISLDQDFKGYADFSTPITAEITAVGEGSADIAGLDVSVNGKVLFLSASDEGRYKDIQVTITDSRGIEYNAPLVSLLVGSGKPQLTLDKSATFKWVQNNIQIFGTASDKNELKTVSWSTDEGLTWFDIVVAEDGTWSANIPLDKYADGLIPLDIRAINSIGSENRLRSAIRKDTTAPSVQLIVPLKGSVVNGETTLVFKVTDNGGKLIQAQSLTVDIETPTDTSYELSEESYYPTVDEDTLDTDDITNIAKPEELELSPLIRHLVGTAENPLTDSMSYSFTDAAGNTTIVNNYAFTIDNESDRPIVEINVPVMNTIVQTDFEVSGVVYDDDGPCKVWASIDGGEFELVADNANSFFYQIELSTLTDNEHYITVYAEDIHGVKGEEKSVTFNVSLAEPKANVVSPAMEKTVNGLVTINGTASDANGISKVLISVDNGNTYNDAEGTEIWQYVFDTRLLQDGTHVIFLRVIDTYGIEGFYSSILNIDNTQPDVQIDLPLDGSSTAGTLFLSGQTTDNIGLEKLWLNITALDRDIAPVPEELAYIELTPDVIISEVIDISSLEDGLYNIEITGEDVGGNTRRVSRNINLNSAWQDTVVDLMYPLTGENVQGIFNIYGQAVSRKPIAKLILFVNNTYVAETTLAETGYFKFVLTPELLGQGTHSMHVRAVTEDGTLFESNRHIFNYTPIGAWISIDNFTMGDFAINRPWIEGSAGYAMAEQDLAILQSEESSKEEKELVESKALKTVEISFDNGKTFEVVGKNEKWRYRIENDYLQEGYHFLIVRATMENGEQALTRSIIQIDKTAPVIKLISPGEGGRFNEELNYTGLTSDDVKLQDVTVALRSGDKGSYGVPKFMQGLYLDLHFLGSTLYDIGVGLSLFDDNVKFQIQFGQLTQSHFTQMSGSTAPFRYGGFVYGAKLLANVGILPFESLFGPDWSWLSGSIALGANFSWFSETQSGKGQILSAVLLQLEFPRVTIPNQKFFRTISLYTEGQLWFIPTDVASSNAADIKSVIPQIAIGLRVNVF